MLKQSSFLSKNAPPQTFTDAQQRIEALGGHLARYLGVDDLVLRLPGQRRAYRVSFERALRVIEKLEATKYSEQGCYNATRCDTQTSWRAVGRRSATQ